MKGKDSDKKGQGQRRKRVQADLEEKILKMSKRRGRGGRQQTETRQEGKIRREMAL